MLLPLALPAPYDYLVPKGMTVAPGQFVVAPLWHGRLSRRGVAARRERRRRRRSTAKKLREIIEVVDDVPPLPRVSLDFADWVASYTLSSPGMVLAHDDERGPRLLIRRRRAMACGSPGPAPERMTPARARVLEVGE